MVEVAHFPTATVPPVIPEDVASGTAGANGTGRNNEEGTLMGILWQEIWGAIEPELLRPAWPRTAGDSVSPSAWSWPPAWGASAGVRRTLRRRPAGLRTHMLVSLGAAAYVLVPEQADMKVAGT